MKINSLLQEGITTSSSPENAQSPAPQIGRSDKVLETNVEESTTSGSVATVASPVGGMQKRSKNSIFNGIKTSKKFANSEAVKEDVTDEGFLGFGEPKPQQPKQKLDYAAARRMSQQGVGKFAKQYHPDEYVKRYGAFAEEDMEEGEEFGSFAGLKDWREWNVQIMNNFYAGKYADYGARLYSVVASSPEEARQVVLDNPDYVLQDLLSRKLQNGKRVLPRGSALPIEDKRVGGVERIKPGSLTTMGFKKMLTPEGPMNLKFSGGKIVASQDQVEKVNEVNPHNYDSDVDYYNAVRNQGRQQFSGDWDVEDEIASLKNRIKYSKSSALAQQYFNQIRQLRQDNGLEIPDEDYYGDWDDENHRIDDEGHRIDNFGNRIEEARKAAANTKTVRKALSKRPPAKLSDKEQAQKKSESDAAWERLMAYAADQKKKEVGEARVGNRMSDISVGSPKIVNYKGKAVGEVGIDHDPSPGNGPYYWKHYLTGKYMVGYDTKQQALGDLKYLVMQNEGGELDENRGYFDGMPSTENDVFRIPGPDAKPFNPNIVGNKPTQQPSKPPKYQVGQDVTVYMGPSPGVATINKSQVSRGKIIEVDPTGDMYRYRIKLENGTLAWVGDKRIDATKGVEEGLGGDMAKLIGIPAVAGALAVGAGHLDKQQPHVEIGGQSAKIVRADTTKMPRDAMLLKGKDGKMYHVWMTRGTGSGHTLLASPAEEVKEGMAEGNGAEQGAYPHDFRSFQQDAQAYGFSVVNAPQDQTGNNTQNFQVLNNQKQIVGFWDGIAGNGIIAKTPQEYQQKITSAGGMSNYGRDQYQKDVNAYYGQGVVEAGGNVPGGMTWQGGKLQKRPELVAAARAEKNRKAAMKRKAEKEKAQQEKGDEAEISEDKLASDLYKDLQIFKKGADKDIGPKAKNKDIGNKPKDKDIVAKEDCWDGYQQVGMKKKDGKTVPNCVPKK